MPLSVDIKINDRTIETVWIGRLERLKSHTDEHEYIVGIGTKYREAWNMPDVSDGDLPRFYHTYSDGARECVRKALNALWEAEL